MVAGNTLHCIRSGSHKKWLHDAEGGDTTSPSPFWNIVISVCMRDDMLYSTDSNRKQNHDYATWARLSSSAYPTSRPPTKTFTRYLTFSLSPVCWLLQLLAIWSYMISMYGRSVFLLTPELAISSMAGLLGNGNCKLLSGALLTLWLINFWWRCWLAVLPPKGLFLVSVLA